MSDNYRIWFLHGASFVVVLAWHEGTATVVDLDADMHPIEMAEPYLVKSRDLRWAGTEAPAMVPVR